MNKLLPGTHFLQLVEGQNFSSLVAFRIKNFIKGGSKNHLEVIMLSLRSIRLLHAELSELFHIECETHANKFKPGSGLDFQQGLSENGNTPI